MNERRVALVTGASRGIGAAIVERLIATGHLVIGIDVDEPSLADLAERFAPTDLRTVVGDVGEPAAWEEAVDAAHAAAGPVSVLVNNAAISPKVDGRRVPSDQVTRAEWDEVLRVNLTGAFLGFQATVGDMREQGWGRIVMMSSGSAKAGARVAGVHYGTSKAALLGLTRTLALELGPDGITVNAITPGRIATPMAAAVSAEVNQMFLDEIPVGRLGTGADIAAMVDFLASDDAGFITGATFDVNGGGYIG